MSSKKEELIAKFKEQLEGCGVKVNDSLLEKVTTGLGPSIYNADAATVAGSDPSELATVKNNFLIKKLGLADSPKLDEGIAAVMEKLGSSNRNKYRACVYYLLTEHFGKQSAY